MHSATCYPPVKNFVIDEHGRGYDALPKQPYVSFVSPQPHYVNSVPTQKQYVKYVPVGYADTHSKAVGYMFWLIGFTGAHRFYYGKPLTGLLWFFTFGLLGIGWIVDAFLIPAMDREADARFVPGKIDYNLAWVMFLFFGWFGIHRFYQMKIFTGVLYLLTGGFFVVGLVYDALTLNAQISEANSKQQTHYVF